MNHTCVNWASNSPYGKERLLICSHVCAPHVSLKKNSGESQAGRWGHWGSAGLNRKNKCLLFKTVVLKPKTIWMRIIWNLCENAGPWPHPMSKSSPPLERHKNLHMAQKCEWFAHTCTPRVTTWRWLFNFYSCKG